MYILKVDIGIVIIFQLLLVVDVNGDCSQCGGDIRYDVCSVEDIICLQETEPSEGMVPSKPRDLKLDVFYQMTEASKLQAKLNISWLPPKDVSNLNGFLLQIIKLKLDGSKEYMLSCTNYTLHETTVTGLQSMIFEKPFNCFKEDLYYAYQIRVQSLPKMIHGGNENFAETYIRLPRWPLTPNSPHTWGTYIEVKNNSYWKHVKISFGLAPDEYGFKKYNVMLMKIQSPGIQPSLQELKVYNTTPGESRGVTHFDDLCPGDYKIAIVPSDCTHCALTDTHIFWIHGETGDCRPPPSTTPVPDSIPTLASSLDVSQIILIVCGSLIGVILASMLVAAIIKRKRHKHASGSVNGIENWIYDVDTGNEAPSRDCAAEDGASYNSIHTYDEEPPQLIRPVPLYSRKNNPTCTTSDEYEGKGDTDNEIKQDYDFHPPQPLDSIGDDESIATHYSNSKHKQ